MNSGIPAQLNLNINRWNLFIIFINTLAIQRDEDEKHDEENRHEDYIEKDPAR